MGNDKDNNKENEVSTVETDFGLFRENEIKAKIKEAEKKGAPAIVGEDGEQAETEIKIEKIEATKGTHAIRWLEQEGEVRVFTKELVYEPKTGNKFLRNVFFIVLTMLIVTAGLNALITFKICLLAINYYWACSTWARLKPHNIIGLILGVAAMSCFIAGLPAYYGTKLYFFQLILFGLILPVFICLMLSLTTYWNFTNASLFIVIVPFGSVGIILAVTLLTMYGFMPKVAMNQLTYELGYTSVILILLIIELRLILGGHYVDVLEDDHSFVAWLLYSSTLTFALKIVQTFDLFDFD